MWLPDGTACPQQGTIPAALPTCPNTTVSGFQSVYPIPTIPCHLPPLPLLHTHLLQHHIRRPQEVNELQVGQQQAVLGVLHDALSLGGAVETGHLAAAATGAKVGGGSGRQAWLLQCEKVEGQTRKLCE